MMTRKDKIEWIWSHCERTHNASDYEDLINGSDDFLNETIEGICESEEWDLDIIIENKV